MTALFHTRPAKFAARSHRNWSAPVARERHRVTRQGDEMACSCGMRWPVGESHP